VISFPSFATSATRPTSILTARPLRHRKRSGDLLIFSGNELTDTLYGAAHLIAQIKQEIFGGEREELTPYDRSDVHEIVKTYVAYRDTKNKNQ
jgi:hypothetical protein